MFSKYYKNIFQKIKLKNSFYIIRVGINSLDKGIEPWTTPEDVKEPQDKQVVVNASRSLGRGRELVRTTR